jgi:uncharacterized OB-fold protein
MSSMSTPPPSGDALGLPVPQPDEISRPFFEGAEHGELRLQRCCACGAWHLGARRCDQCSGADLQWTQVSGRGKVYSFVIVHQQYHPAVAHRLPYNVAIVETEEGPRLPANIIGVGRDELQVGMPVSVVFERVSDTTWIPRFRPDPTVHLDEAEQQG